MSLIPRSSDSKAHESAFLGAPREVDVLCTLLHHTHPLGSPKLHFLKNLISFRLSDEQPLP